MNRQEMKEQAQMFREDARESYALAREIEAQIKRIPKVWPVGGSVRFLENDPYRWSKGGKASIEKVDNDFIYLKTDSGTSFKVEDSDIELVDVEAK